MFTFWSFTLVEVVNVLLRPFFNRHSEAHQQIGTNIKKWGAQKLEKCEGGCVGFRDPKFLNEKIKEYDAKNRLQFGWG